MSIEMQAFLFFLSMCAIAAVLVRRGWHPFVVTGVLVAYFFASNEIFKLLGAS